MTMHHLLRSAIVIVAGALVLAACGGGTGTAAQSPPPATATPSASSDLVKTATATVAGKSETILTDQEGMTLYTYTADKGGKVGCTGHCLTLWPPLSVPKGVTTPTGSGLTGTLGTAQVPGGGSMVTYNNWPLYRWVQDKSPGDTTGQNITDSGGTWYVATPDMAAA